MWLCTFFLIDQYAITILRSTRLVLTPPPSLPNTYQKHKENIIQVLVHSLAQLLLNHALHIHKRLVEDIKDLTVVLVKELLQLLDIVRLDVHLQMLQPILQVLFDVEYLGSRLAAVLVDLASVYLGLARKHVHTQRCIRELFWVHI